jgi:hypothetical protein
VISFDRTGNVRRRWFALAAPVAAVAAVAVVAAIAAGTSSAARAGRDVGSTATTTDARYGAPSERKAPHYLPPGVSRAQTSTPFQNAAVEDTAFTIDGRQNSSSPPSSIQFLSRPGSDVEPVPGDGFTKTATFTNAGTTYFGAFPVTGFGNYRLDWTDGQYVYTLMVDRLNKTDGVSGVDFGELKKMAYSVS